jgi:hypothetical protein
VQDTKLFETILGLQAPWHIARLKLKADAKRVDLVGARVVAVAVPSVSALT